MKLNQITLTISMILILFLSCSKDDAPAPEPTLVSFIETIQPGEVEGKDAFIYTYQPDRNLGDHPDFMSNKFSAATVRSFIRFDFSNIPSNAIVDSVKVSLFSYQSTSNGSHLQYNRSLLQKVDATWTEDEITWNNQPTSSIEDQLILETPENSIQDYLDIDITDMAKGMISNPDNNYGFVLKLEDELSSGKMVFGSSDNINPDLHPKVVVYYSLYQ